MDLFGKANQDLWKVTEKLYNKVKRKVLKIDDGLDDLLNLLT